MGAVSALVYIFAMFCFIPFPFYKFLVTETSGAGNRDVELAVQPNFIENGRTLHLFPHNKVAPQGRLGLIDSWGNTLQPC
jgi:UDP-N-acetylglucosamine--dolichyl-phosphate N-acetylglucosaminephosphotransferase